MDMTGERVIAAPRQRVWEALNNPKVLKDCIPSCESVEKVSDTEMTAKAAIRIGPMAAKFGGVLHLSDLDPPNGYTIAGEGQGGAAGFAKGGAKVSLAEEPGGGTRLSYKVEAQVGGKMAQIGARLIDATAKSMAEQFFTRFAAAVEQPGAATSAGQPIAAAPVSGVVFPPVAVAAVAAGAIFLAFLLGRESKSWSLRD